LNFLLDYMRQVCIWRIQDDRTLPWISRFTILNGSLTFAVYKGENPRIDASLRRRYVRSQQRACSKAQLP
ncbi:hypothetical protein KCU66_g49, partial [Aureobasidium melanogenum]